MGCIKSKRSRRAEDTKPTAKADRPPSQQAGEKAALVASETGPGRDSPKIDPVLLDYAQRLSEEIVARAVQQWAEVDSRYGDIPYIECDLP
ncbi:small membrane A-kinase anchor protein-like [Anguilla anguilla]|uniref:small membrane A-kinase anchor protein-like n=1 Tax=Anguilla anguilla TaxID=7936 RepID=UPI0015AA19D7|nr:small membrane A-kinase anchor protein-like [Anguilla anguilla]XP_035250640.1 small membrane A-kinase anchor protein-like [Anguilla anguilla]